LNEVFARAGGARVGRQQNRRQQEDQSPSEEGVRASERFEATSNHHSARILPALRRKANC
jgi:hypothetical protein